MSTSAKPTRNQNATITSATPNDDTATGSTEITAAISRMKELGINFLALDFDQTILDIHTGGRWRGAKEELYPNVRPVMAQLIQSAVRHEMQVAIVTFSGQINIVRGILDHVVGKEASQRIPIRGNDRSWTYNGTGSVKGKQPHMASAVEELEVRCQTLEITPDSTLLIDDDSRNIRYALKEGTRAIWFNPEQPHLLLHEIMRLE